MVACPDENALLRFAEGSLPDPEQEVVRSHIGECSICLSLIMELMQMAGTAEQEQATAATRAPAAGALPVAGTTGALPTADAPASAWRPPEQIDEYRLGRPLGRGAMGQVFLGHDLRLDRPVAVKFLSAIHSHGEGALSDVERERFQVEARAVARLAHANVVAVYRVGELSGRPYLVSEYVRGQSLDHLARPLPADQVLRLGLGLARGLAAAHRGGVLHRDIKPANAMLTDDGEVKLLDFGLAKLLAGSAAEAAGARPEPGAAPLAAAPDEPLADSPVLTRTGTALGTPLYMAPEIWAGKPATARSDVYSLGALLYELASGSPPHTAGQLEALKQIVMTQDAPALLPRAPSVDPRLSAVVDRCLRRRPAERFASGVELSQAVEQLLAKRSSRSAPALGILLAGLCALAALIVYVQAIRERSRKQAETAALTARLEQERQRTDSARQVELGKQAVELARHPARDLEALAAAVRAAGPSLNAGREPPQEAREGLFAAVGSRAHLRPERIFLFGPNIRISAATFSPDGRQVLVASGLDATLIDAESGRPLMTLRDPEADLLTASYSPDGRRILTVSGSAARLWDAHSGAMLQVFPGPVPVPLEAPFSVDGKQVLTVGVDGAARVWSSESGALLATLTGHRGMVADGRFSPDGTTVLTAGEDGSARLWSAHTAELRPVSLPHDRPLVKASFSPDGQRILTEDAERLAKLWDARTGRPVAAMAGVNRSLDMLLSHFTSSAAFSADGSQVVMPGEDALVRIWDARTGTSLGTLDGGEPVLSAVLHPDSQQLLTISQGSVAALWDTRSRRLLAALLHPKRDVLRFAALSRDGKRALTASFFSVALWDIGRPARPLRGPAASAGAPLGRSPERPDEVYAPACQRRVTLGHPSQLLDTVTGKPLADLDRSELVTAAAFSPDCRLLLTGFQDGEMLLWDARTGQDGRWLSRHSGAVRGAHFAPSGPYAATLGDDRTVRLWNVQNGELFGTLSGFTSPVVSIAFRQDGQALSVVDAEGAARSVPLALTDLFARACALLYQGLNDKEVSAQCLPFLHKQPKAHPLSGDLLAGRPDQVPDAWWLSRAQEREGYTAAITQTGCPRDVPQCLHMAQDRAIAGREGILMHRVDGAPLRGKRLRLRALVRVGASEAGPQARLVAEVDRLVSGREPLYGLVLRSRSEAVASQDWRRTDLVFDVAEDALEIRLGLALAGAGPAWFASVVLEEAGTAPLQDERTHPTPRNLRFEEGPPGQLPPGWGSSFISEQLGYRASLTSAGCAEGRSCACLSSASASAALSYAKNGEISQRIDAAPYRGKRVRLRARAHADLPAPRAAGDIQTGNQAALWLATDGQWAWDFTRSCKRSIVDPDWKEYEIVCAISEAATQIDFGLGLRGRGTAWIDAVAIDVVDGAAITADSVSPLPRNLDFEESSLEQGVNGWRFSSFPLPEDYKVEIVGDGCRSGQRCARIDANFAMVPYQYRWTYLAQRFAAGGFRGRRARLRMAVRVEVPSTGMSNRLWQSNHGQLWLRVDRAGSQVGFFNNMANRRITNREWQDYEIIADIDPDAEFVNIGFLFYGRGTAWIDAARFDVLADGPAAPR